jgi:hypothetical protein
MTGTYRFVTTLGGTPASGTLRLNAGHPYTQATTVSIHHLSDDDIDLRPSLAAQPSGTTLYLQDRDDATRFVRFTTTAAGTDHGAYFTFPVQWVANGAAFGNNQPILVTFPDEGSAGVTAHHATHETGGADAITALDAAVLTSGTLPDTRLPANVARRDQANTFVVEQTISAVRPTLVLADPATATTRKSRVLQAVTTEPRTDLTANLYYDGTNWLRDDTSVPGVAVALTQTTWRLRQASGGTPPTLADRLRLDMNTGQLFERGRTVAMGEWTAVSYASGNFTAPQGGTWTVNSSALIYTYTVIGGTLLVNLSIGDATLSGVSASTVQYLRIALPVGFTVQGYARAIARLVIAGTAELAWLNVATSGTGIEIYRTGYGYYPAGSSTILVDFQIAIPIA